MAKAKAPVYEDYNYLFFTVKYRCYLYNIRMEVYLGERFLIEYDFRIVNDVFPTQERLNNSIESIIFDKIESLFTEKFAREDHEHRFVAR